VVVPLHFSPFVVTDLSIFFLSASLPVLVFLLVRFPRGSLFVLQCRVRQSSAHVLIAWCQTVVLVFVTLRISIPVCSRRYSASQVAPARGFLTGSRSRSSSQGVGEFSFVRCCFLLQSIFGPSPGAAGVGQISFFFSRDFWSLPLSRSPLSVFAAASASVKSAPFLLHLLHRFPLALKHSRYSGQPRFVAARIFLEARNAWQIICPVSVAVQASSSRIFFCSCSSLNNSVRLRLNFSCFC
jgi:hypothetical protein